MIGETLQAGFAASTEAVRPGGLDLERSVSVVTLLGFAAAAITAIAKGIHWLLGRVFIDKLTEETKALRQLVELLRDENRRRWDTHDERAQDLIDRVHDLEAGCAARHERLTRHERS
jgi:hypothetical protein